jgi:acyl-homoserine-lactone acylase
VIALIKSIQEWDKKAKANSKGAATFAVFYHHLRKYYNDLGEGHIYDEATLVKVLIDSKKYMLTHFKTTDITLGDFQKVVRGSKVYPSFGLPDVLTAMHGTAYKDGKLKITAGESYIQLTKFTKKGVEIESIISYGSSDHPDSKHYNDQLELYMQFKTKKCI